MYNKLPAFNALINESWNSPLFTINLTTACFYLNNCLVTNHAVNMTSFHVVFSCGLFGCIEYSGEPTWLEICCMGFDV